MSLKMNKRAGCLSGTMLGFPCPLLRRTGEESSEMLKIEGMSKEVREVVAAAGWTWAQFELSNLWYCNV